MNDLLSSWRDGETRNAVVGFLEASADIPPDMRVAVFDNDGTLWCEKPRYTQLDFLLWELRNAADARPELRAVPEYEAILVGDQAAIAEFGLERVAMALVALFEGEEPAAFEAQVRRFLAEARHPERGVRYDHMVYLPMLELLDALERRGFATCVVTGGGTEFVRAFSREVYGVDPERVVGTLVTYALDRREGKPVLVRTKQQRAEANEGGTKVANIQLALGRRPVLAAGNSPGDHEMLEYTAVANGPSLALLVNHDDEEREYAYQSEAATFESLESSVDTAQRLGWTVVSMRDDWETIFVGS